MGDHDNCYTASLPLSLAHMLSLQPGFLSGRVANLQVADIQAAKDNAVTAIDFVRDQFSCAVGAIAIHACGYPEVYDLEDHREYNPEKDRVETVKRTLSDEGIQRLKNDVIKAAQYFCNGADAYFDLLDECVAELADRGKPINGSRELLEMKLLESALDEIDNKLLYFDFSDQNEGPQGPLP